MKRLFLICYVMLGITAVSRAQGGGYAPPSPADQAARLKTSLALNDDQTTKVTAIFTKQAASRDSLMKAANGDFQSMRPAMMAMQATYNAQIKVVLTPDQAAAYQKQLDARMNRGGGGGGMGGGGGGTPPPPNEK